jgi:hypothetical protein
MQSRHGTNNEREDFSMTVLLRGSLNITVRQARMARIVFRFSPANKGIWKEVVGQFEFS